MPRALTRAVSPALADCELSFQQRQPIDVDLARRQHTSYCAALSRLGLEVTTLPAIETAPDCVFVEDPALVLDGVAVMTRMGAVSRRAESESLAEAIAPHREILRITEPATLEGGDVMRIDTNMDTKMDTNIDAGGRKTLYVGLSKRTNYLGIQQLARLLEPYGYWVTPVEVRGCLHLKSACCYLGEVGSGEGDAKPTMLANRDWIDTDGLCGLEILDVDPTEPHAANVLRIGDTILMPSSYPRTRARLEAAGLNVQTVDTSELIKAEAGVTCMSLIF